MPTHRQTTVEAVVRQPIIVEAVEPLQPITAAEVQLITVVVEVAQLQLIIVVLHELIMAVMHQRQQQIIVNQQQNKLRQISPSEPDTCDPACHVARTATGQFACGILAPVPLKPACGLIALNAHVVKGHHHHN